MTTSLPSTCTASAPASAATATTEANRLLPAVRPAADVIEREDAFVLSIELPGVVEADIDIRHERGVLSVSAPRPRPSGETARVLLREFGAVRFTRAFRLPEDGSLDASRIGARFSAGVLEITLPKSEQARPRRVPVQG